MSYYVTMFVLGLFVGLFARVAYAEGERLLQVARYKRLLESCETDAEWRAVVEERRKTVERKFEWL